MYTLTPFFYALMAAYFMLIVAAVWVVFDSYRAQRIDQLTALEKATGKRREPIAFYRIYCAILVILYLLNILFSLLPMINGRFRWVFSLISLFWALAGVFVILIYLLRVVYPKVPSDFDELSDQLFSDIPATRIDDTGGNAPATQEGEVISEELPVENGPPLQDLEQEVVVMDTETETRTEELPT
ncbi:MAG: hypothetical protein FWE87_02465 [Coriobacteriia bacterium]|nr:hypothetical protein [Coriobacteriia bacterium]